jgi:hypothetical protein
MKVRVMLAFIQARHTRLMRIQQDEEAEEAVFGWPFSPV